MKISKKDIFFISLRVTVMASLILYLGILNGIFVSWIYRLANYYLMKYLFRLEAVAPIDTLFVHDDHKNVANVISNNT